MILIRYAFSHNIHEFSLVLMLLEHNHSTKLVHHNNLSIKKKNKRRSGNKLHTVYIPVN